MIVSPDLVQDLSGRDITLRVLDPEPAPGERHLFLATGLEFGDEVALAELARAPHQRREESELRRVIVEARLRADDEALQNRLQRAEAVVYGFVHTVERLPPTATGPQAKGESRVRWQVAHLIVWRALKGSPPQEPAVIFPSERTQRWSDSPLFLTRQEGVWLLHDSARPDAGPAHQSWPAVPDGYLAIDSLDFHSPGAVERIRLLLQLTRPPRTGR